MATMNQGGAAQPKERSLDGQELQRLGAEQADPGRASLGAALALAGDAQGVAAEPGARQPGCSTVERSQNAANDSATARLLTADLIGQQESRGIATTAALGSRNGDPSMSIMTGFLSSVATEPPQPSALLRDAIAAHETKMSATADTRAQVLSLKVLAILNRPVDRIAYLPRPHREPVAIVDGVQFRWIPERYDSMEPGWLMVRTDADGWVEVDSIEQLGAQAKRYGLALVPTS